MQTRYAGRRLLTGNYGNGAKAWPCCKIRQSGNG